MEILTDDLLESLEILTCNLHNEPSQSNCSIYLYLLARSFWEMFHTRWKNILVYKGLNNLESKHHYKCKENLTRSFSFSWFWIQFRAKDNHKILVFD